MEMILAKILQELLNKAQDTIARDAEFFDLGGDSIQAIHLVSRLRKQGYHLTVGSVFDHPILSDLALQIKSGPQDSSIVVEPLALLSSDQVKRLDSALSVYSLNLADVQDIYPMSPMQQDLVALTLQDPKQYVSQNVFGLPSDLDIELFSNSWLTVAMKNPILRTTFIYTDDAVYQNIGGCLQVVFKSPLGVAHEKVSDLDHALYNDLARGFELGLPFCRLTILEYKNNLKLVVTMHHALYDGWCRDEVL